MYALNTLKKISRKKIYFSYIQGKITQKDKDKLLFVTGMNAPISLKMEPTHLC